MAKCTIEQQMNKIVEGLAKAYGIEKQSAEKLINKAEIANAIKANMVVTTEPGVMDSAKRISNIEYSGVNNTDGSSKKGSSENSTIKSKVSKKFKGYFGGYDTKGKGTKEGDGKDKEMRRISSGTIAEVINTKKSHHSSTLTSINANDNFAKRYGIAYYLKKKYDDKKTRFADGKVYVIQTELNSELNSPEANSPEANVIMLARNGAIPGSELMQETKEMINKAHVAGKEFVVGDMPRTDGAFIEHLNDIGAT